MPYEQRRLAVGSKFLKRGLDVEPDTASNDDSEARSMTPAMRF